MNHKTIISLVIFLLLAGGLTIFLLNKDSADNQSVDRPAQINQEQEEQSTEQQSSQYVEYSEERLLATSGEKILFFHAPWCPQCRKLESDILENEIPENLTIFKVDYDSNQALRQKYGVTIQTTLVKVDDEGNLIDKYVAYSDPTLETVLENLN